ncbi:related to Protein DOA1 [Saccharomycodes ludwigii]|uniref:Related to Protein DOA1 n=1 Tax=Saccharomycodes ludwigii TaxID=36035 RepID=A0A376B4P7_9ASCO|nr:hypothetical protein SCDLUD_002233 [Saccharomycodes ludwigii]KAH3902411.1 hypothetical protein SCDLUD_002233 [Saccharomycodes ludwigii]SSD59666.1 related to Protein DOA1 [Saccharomycodes ludwigii]
MAYTLSATLEGHDQDVRNLIAIDASTFASCSRDGSVRTWMQDNINGASSNEWKSLLVHHTTAFINSLCFLDGILYCGGTEVIIQGFPYLSSQEENNNEPLFSLIGHSKNVCALSSYSSDDGDDYIISGSWDQTAIVWQNGEPLYRLVGHEASVWDAKFINKHKFITCSADKTVKIWENDKCVSTFTHLHTDVIRSIDVLGDHFITSSNDGTIKYCDFDGKILKEFLGHESFVYQAIFAQDKKIISCGEDRSIRIWDLETGNILQVITVPSISVWSVVQLNNGDIVAGSSDHLIRVFTQEKSRFASDLELEKFRSSVENSAINSKTLGIDETKLSPYEVLQFPGKKEGQVVAVKTPTGAIEAHQYSSGVWGKIGDVVGSSGNESKVEFEGQTYDYVFDVDVEEGKPPLKLPCNANDNPYDVAEQFLAKYDLPASFKDQVVRFIIKNTGGVDLSTKENKVKVSNILPSKENFLSLDNFNVDKLYSGICKLNSNEENNFEEPTLNELRIALENPATNVDFLWTNAAIIRANWKQKVPAYDILRIIVPYLPSPDNLTEFITEGLTSESLVVKMLTVRSLVNIFQNSDWGLELMSSPSIYESIFSVIDSEYSENFRQKPQMAIAISSLVYNYTVLILRENKYELIPTIADVLNNKYGSSHLVLDSEEASYRLLIAFGNLATIEHSLLQYYSSISWIKDVKARYGTEKRFSYVFDDLSSM